MVSAKQVGRRRPAFRPQTCWRRGQLFLQMYENLVNDHWIFNAGDDPHCPAACAASLDVDTEDSLEALRPGHCGPAFGGGVLLALVGRFGFAPPPPLAGVTNARCLLLGANRP